MVGGAEGRSPRWISAACSRSRARSCSAPFELGKARVLDPDRRDVRHHGEQVQVVFGELADHRRRIHIDDADDPVAGLQRHRDQGPDILFDDAAALPECIVKGRYPGPESRRRYSARGRVRPR